MLDQLGKIAMISVLIVSTAIMLFYILHSFVLALHGKADAASGLASNAVRVVRYLT